MTFEQIFSQMADKAMAKRTIAPAHEPRILKPYKDYWNRILTALGTDWVRSSELVERTGLTMIQLQGQLIQPKNRCQLEVRGNRGSGYEWKSREVCPR